MVRLIEVCGNRCLSYVSQPIASFQILVGANAGGKSTFLDCVRLLGDLLNGGLEAALAARSPNLEDLVWMRGGKRFEVAVELEIPPDRCARHPQNGYTRARHEVTVGFNEGEELSVLGETLGLGLPTPESPVQRELFPELTPGRPIVAAPGSYAPQGRKRVVSRRPESGIDYFHSETTGWNSPFRLGPRRLALANLPEDEERFPVAVWVKQTLMEGVHWVALNSDAMRRPSPPGRPAEFQPDGSNLPWVLQRLGEADPARHARWIDHVRTALPDIQTVETVERPEGRHRYLRIAYATGLRTPSWTVSDGTLRLLALTLIPCLPDRNRILLIEEPENGINPRGVETVFQSLSSAYEHQVLCAGHSTVLLPLAEPQQILRFARADDGATDIVRGNLHPNLRNRQKEADLGILFATGVLG